MHEIRIFKINECATFAGRSMAECIDDAINNYGEEYDESEAYEVSEEDMQTLKVYDEDLDRHISYSDFLDEMINDGTEFPCLFCHTEL